MAVNEIRPDDQEIFRLLKQPASMEVAINELYIQHFESLRRFIQNNSGSWSEAQEVIERVMTRFVYMVHSGKLKEEKGIKNYLYALNKDLWIAELIRKGKLQPAVDDRLVPAHKESHYYIHRSFNKLGQACKKLLMAVYFNKYHKEQVVQVLGYRNLNEYNLKKSACLDKFQKQIAEDEKKYKELTVLLHE